MKKTVVIKGMSCAHCKMRTEKALNAIKGVKAEVSLEKGTATVTFDPSESAVSDSALKEAVEALGFDVVSIT
ncbi:MAG: cation transporter [Oscillospiraceae bacterium]|nr:cation transporter [Oscillospiraceae bacterium]